MNEKQLPDLQKFIDFIINKRLFPTGRFKKLLHFIIDIINDDLSLPERFKNYEISSSEFREIVNFIHNFQNLDIIKNKEYKELHDLIKEAKEWDEYQQYLYCLIVNQMLKQEMEKRIQDA